MDLLKAILCCLADRNNLLDNNNNNSGCNNAVFTEKEDQLANDIVEALFTAEKPLKISKDQLDDKVHTDGWYEELAKRILNRVASALDAGKAMGPAMKQAFDRASNTAKEFVEKHPVYTAAILTVLAIGILVLLIPWVVEALGFAELGPVEGSFAAMWQSTFPDAEAGSIFSYLQRLGMKWGRK